MYRTKCNWFSSRLWGVLSDTAGLREATEDEIEREGMRRAREAVDNSQLVIFVFDGSDGVGAMELLRKLREESDKGTAEAADGHRERVGGAHVGELERGNLCPETSAPEGASDPRYMLRFIPPEPSALREGLSYGVVRRLFFGGENMEKDETGDTP